MSDRNLDEPLFVAGKHQQGVMKKMEDGVIKEYNLYDEHIEEDFEDILDNTIDVLGKNMIVPERGTVVRKTNNIEEQITNAYNTQIDSYINRLMSNNQIQNILSKNKFWYKDDDFLNVITSKVVNMSNGNLIYEEVKQNLKNKYNV